MKVENDNAREFYMQEAVKSQWSTRQLERQINSFFYERLLSSKNKEQVATEIQTLEPAKKPEDIIRDPYVLEFLGLSSNDDFFESDLEQALITHLQKFLLELGRGFSFVARQKRITFDGRHFRIDLVFYNLSTLHVFRTKRRPAAFYTAQTSRNVSSSSSDLPLFL